MWKRLILGFLFFGFAETAVAQQLRLIRNPDLLQVFYNSRDRDAGVVRPAYSYYVTGFAPNQVVEWEYDSVVEREVISDACGGLRIKYEGDPSITILAPVEVVLPPGISRGQLLQDSYIPSAFSKGLIPKCKDGKWDVPPTRPVRTATELFLYNGMTSGGAVKFIPPSTKHYYTFGKTFKRKVTTNACGYFTIRGFHSATEIRVNGQLLRVSGDLQNRLICHRSKAGNYRMFEQIADVLPKPPQAPVSVAPPNTPTVGGTPITPSDLPNPIAPVNLEFGYYWDGSSVVPVPSGFYLNNRNQLQALPDGYQYTPIGLVPTEYQGIPILFYTYGPFEREATVYLDAGRPMSGTFPWNTFPSPIPIAWDYDPSFNIPMLLQEINGSWRYMTVNVAGFRFDGTAVQISVYVSMPYAWY